MFAPHAWTANLKHTRTYVLQDMEPLVIQLKEEKLQAENARDTYAAKAFAVEQDMMKALSRNEELESEVQTVRTYYLLLSAKVYIEFNANNVYPNLCVNGVPDVAQIAFAENELVLRVDAEKQRAGKYQHDQVMAEKALEDVYGVNVRLQKQVLYWTCMNFVTTWTVGMHK